MKKKKRKKSKRKVFGTEVSNIEKEKREFNYRNEHKKILN